MAVAANADDYASTRVGMFFPASSDNTLNDGDLTGQCVTLVKWFLGEMCGVSNPGIARGNARDYGDELVREGLASVVGTPQRGDIVVWKNDGEGYGHIGVVLSGGRVFEENINVVGTTTRNVDGTIVHSSRIGSLSEPWRIGPPTFYRVNGYIENVNGGNNVAIIADADNWRMRAGKSFEMIRGRSMGAGEFEPWIGQDFLHLIEALEDNPEADANVDYANWGRTAKNDHWDQQIYGLEAQLKDSQTALSNEQAKLAADDSTVADLKGQLDAAHAALAAQQTIQMTKAQDAAAAATETPEPAVDTTTQAKLDQLQTATASNNSLLQEILSLLKSVRGMLVNFIGFVKRR